MHVARSRPDGPAARFFEIANHSPV